jgi:hypothetical protein
MAGGAGQGQNQNFLSMVLDISGGTSHPAAILGVIFKGFLDSSYHMGLTIILIIS